MNNPNENEWWEDDLRRMFHGVWGASPWNEERMTDSAIEVCKKLFQEATRRGIQQGKREAWEEIKKAMDEICTDGQSPSIQDVWDRLLNEKDAQLSALSNSQDKDL